MRFLVIFLFLFQPCIAQQRYEIIIDEIMADPSPQVGLPNTEYLELKNVSNRPVNLNGLKIYNDDQFSRIAVDVILSPDSFLILCSSASLGAMAAFGRAIVPSNFSALNNSGATLSLISRDGVLLHAVHYSTSWFNEIKSNGGWSLEMIDTHHPCVSNENWTASIAPAGGTPGKKNAVEGIVVDKRPPSLVNAFASDSLSLLFIFDETLDSSSAVLNENFIVRAGNVIPVTATILPPLFNSIVLKPATRLQEHELLTVSIKGVKDCTGNIAPPSSFQTGLAGSAGINDVIINELLFNPQPGGYDFVELFNRSKKIIDLKNLFISNRTNAGNLSPPIRITTDSKLLLPEGYAAITGNIAVLTQQYLIKLHSALVENSGLPSLPDDRGTVVILNAAGLVTDELKYDEDWHFKLLDKKDGVSLERISAVSPTQDAKNWHSAATTAGFATPGYKNSQAYAMGEIEQRIKLSPEVFSPDNDGLDDFTTLSYRFPTPGYVMTITIFSTQGTPVRFLSKNLLCGIEGYLRWDGLDEQHQLLPRGVYILLIECFNLEGRRSRTKKTITIVNNMR